MLTQKQQEKVNALSEQDKETFYGSEKLRKIILDAGLEITLLPIDMDVECGTLPDGKPKLQFAFSRSLNCIGIPRGFNPLDRYHLLSICHEYGHYLDCMKHPSYYPLPENENEPLPELNFLMEFLTEVNAWKYGLEVYNTLFPLSAEQRELNGQEILDCLMSYYDVARATTKAKNSSNPFEIILLVIYGPDKNYMDRETKMDKIRNLMYRRFAL